MFIRQDNRDIGEAVEYCCQLWKNRDKRDLVAAVGFSRSLPPAEWMTSAMPFIRSSNELR